MPALVICITGMPGSGKTTTAQMLKRKGFRLLEMSDAIKELVKSAHLPVNIENIELVSIAKKRNLGRDIIAKLTAAKVYKHDRLVTINGVRSIEEIKYLKKRFGAKRVFVLALTAPARVRYERLAKSRSTSYSEFITRERRNSTFRNGLGNIKQIISKADIIIDNSDTTAQLKKKLGKTISSITY